jgi:hypothetical protein
MERGVGMASSNPLGGSDFRESRPIGIKSYPALALLSPGSEYVDMPPYYLRPVYRNG